jgi:hypothetical protein
MSNMLWQDIAVAIIVASALGWLVARRLRRRGKAAACENCPSAAPMPAGVRPAPMPEVLLSIGEPPAGRKA